MSAMKERAKANLSRRRNAEVLLTLLLTTILEILIAVELGYRALAIATAVLIASRDSALIAFWADEAVQEVRSLMGRTDPDPVRVRAHD